MDLLTPIAASPTSDYLSMFNSFPGLTPMGLLTIFFLGFLRIIPIVVLAPFLGAKLPSPVKVGLSVALTFILLPQLVATSSTPLAFDIYFIGYSLKEFLIGVIFGFLASIPFYVAQASGVLIDFQRGSSAMQVQDPLLQTQISPIGILYNYTLIVLFFQFGGPFLFLDMLLQSYTVIPVDGFFSSGFFHLNLPFWQMIVKLLTKFTLLAIQLSAPSLVAILMADMFLGIANRMAPQVQIAFLGMSIKSLLGLALLWAGWFFVLQQLAFQTKGFMQELIKIIPSFRT